MNEIPLVTGKFRSHTHARFKNDAQRRSLGLADFMDAIMECWRRSSERDRAAAIKKAVDRRVKFKNSLN
jgi:hypothetical protein